MKKREIYRENGQLKVNISFDRRDSLLKMEEQIADILDAMKDELSELERLLVKQQMLEALNNEKRKQD